METTTEFSQVSYWEKRYSEKQTQWYVSNAHPSLVNHLPLLTGGSSGKKFLLPLCGRTKDIPYLLSQGHQVLGIEGATQPIVELQSENSIKLNFDPERSLYYTDDHQLEIYNGDIFQCPIEEFGPFDCIWDRAAFVALDIASREAYVELMRRSLVKPDGSYNEFKYLFEGYHYDQNLYPGPPMSVSGEEMQELFGHWALIKELERSPAKKFNSMPLPSDTTANVYLLSNK